MGLQRYAYSYVSKFWRCRVLSIWKGVTRGICPLHMKILE